MQKACIIIPCYNEEKRLPVREFYDFFNGQTTFDFCFVNDGSRDGTLDVLANIQQLSIERIIVINLVENVGKAEAVRQGMQDCLQHSQYEYMGYFDADFSTPLEELFDLMDAFNEHPDCLLVAGSRVKRMGSTIIRTMKRHYLGRVFSTFASVLLKLPVYDTQCGAKLIKRSAAENVFKDVFISRWLFDIEIFARMIKLVGYSSILGSIYEVPLKCWIEKGGSNIKISYLVKVPFELYRISRKYKLRLNTKIIQ